ncbi:hypothetical protein QT971_18790 [Microcoleus sp. herbarium19]|uniref:hypothetical protein n=1 Tax=unclassified Microcoleus TaxID=2642155 RepID=UPI002FD3A0E5
MLQLSILYKLSFVCIPKAGHGNAVSPFVTQLLNSGMSLEQVAQMMNLSTLEVRRLVGEDF